MQILRGRLKILWHNGIRRVTTSIRPEMKRRAAVEPVIGQLKAEHSMGRNYLKGPKGDRINAVLAAAKRLERGRFIWPAPSADGVVAIVALQLAYMLDGIDWRNPRHTWRPVAAG